MLLGGAVAVALRQVGGALDLPILDTVNLVLIVGSALLVSGAVVYSSLAALRSADTERAGSGVG